MNQINILHNELLLSVDDTYPIGLAEGKMGLCIYFYYLSRYEQNEEFKQIGEKLLDDVINNLSVMLDITVRSGLAGIALGIDHLVKKRFIDGDINEILEDIDNDIFNRLAFYGNNETKDRIKKENLLHLLYYLYIRYNQQSSYNEKYIFQELIIKTVEIFKEDLSLSFFNDYFSFSIQYFNSPLFLFIFSQLYKLNIYNDRIIKILEEYIHPILSTVPISHANRLYLLWSLLHIKSCLPFYKKQIELHIDLLKSTIDIDYIISCELKNQDIYIYDGLSVIYMLLYYIHTNFPEYNIEYNPQLFFDRISKSEAWNALLNRKFYFYKHIGLFDGFPGANLVLLHIKRTNL